MYLQCQNIQGNHVAINDCSHVFRLREPRGDRACIWEAEDGTDHALVGTDHGDLVVQAKHCEDGSYWATLRLGQVVILRQNDSFLIELVQQEVLETPLGVLVYSRYGIFRWLLPGGVWEDFVDTGYSLRLNNLSFDPESGEAVGELSLVHSGVQSFCINPSERTITYGQIEGIREPVTPMQKIRMLAKGYWRQAVERIRK